MAAAVRWALQYFIWETLAPRAVVLAGKTHVWTHYSLDLFTFVCQMDASDGWETNYCEILLWVMAMNDLLSPSEQIS